MVVAADLDEELEEIMVEEIESDDLTDFPAFVELKEEVETLTGLVLGYETRMENLEEDNAKLHDMLDNYESMIMAVKDTIAGSLVISQKDLIDSVSRHMVSKFARVHSHPIKQAVGLPGQFTPVTSPAVPTRRTHVQS